MRFGFDHLFDKLRWLDRLTALEIALSTKADYSQKLLDKIACELLYRDYDEILEHMNADIVL